MDTQKELDDNGGSTLGGGEANISHFIPSCELKGSRLEKLQKLDALIVYLERLRRSLAGEVGLDRSSYERPGSRIGSPAWPWFCGGAVLGALFVLLLLTARGCSL